MFVPRENHMHAGLASGTRVRIQAASLPITAHKFTHGGEGGRGGVARPRTGREVALAGVQIHTR